MDLHITLPTRKDLRGAIYRQIRRAILDGRLRPGEPLPPSRELARRLGISRTSVTVAYDRLTGEGFVTTRIGAGTFVSARATGGPRSAPAHRASGLLVARSFWSPLAAFTPFAGRAEFDFRTGLPDGRLFPHDKWRRLVVGELRRESASAGVYAEPSGHRPLREAIARHIAIARGVEAASEDVAITCGTQQALDVIARVLLAPGDRVAVEDPGYPPARRLFASLGIRVLPVPVDEEGLVVEAIPRRTRLVYVTPSHQYPLGVPMSLTRRLALLAWAERNQAAIVEDDYDSEFRFGGRPVEPLQILDRSGRVIYVGSFSKSMLPTLRLGFLVAPPSLRSAIQTAKQTTDWHTAIPMQAALAGFIETGAFARHIRRMRGVYQARHALVAETIAREFGDHLTLVPSEAGLHLAAVARELDAGQVAEVVRRGVEAGVAVHELARFALEPPGRPGIMLGFGGIPTRLIPEGLRRLRSCFDGPGPRPVEKGSVSR
jgi:GntR family transcriptional regulator / MocR family aminotransferase